MNVNAAALAVAAACTPALAVMGCACAPVAVVAGDTSVEVVLARAALSPATHFRPMSAETADSWVTRMNLRSATLSVRTTGALYASMS